MKQNLKKLSIDKLIICVIFCLSLSLTGCEAFRKKFVRKPKREKEIKAIVQTHEYEAKYSIDETYKKYFIFWRTWHEELLNSLNAQDGNRKRRIFAAKKIVENLRQMQKLLLPPLESKLEVFILEQKEIAKQLKRYNVNRLQKLRIKSMLEKQRRQIQREFQYRCVREHLKNVW